MPTPEQPADRLFLVRFREFIAGTGDEYHLADAHSKVPVQAVALCGRVGVPIGNLGHVHQLYDPWVVAYLERYHSWVCWPCQEVLIIKLALRLAAQDQLQILAHLFSR